MIILRSIFKDAVADNIRGDSPIDAIDWWALLQLDIRRCDRDGGERGIDRNNL